MIRIFTAIIALTLLISCNKAEEPQQSPAKKPARAVKQAPLSESTDLTAGISGSAEGAKYRNPFQSHIILMKAVPGAPQKIRGPLECCELGMFKVVAAVVGVSDAEGFALIQAPDGKRYVVRRGDVLGAREGKVMKIHSKGLLIREHTRDEEGKIKSTEDIELRLEKKV
ncbi:MAG: pilus assembly protein PilP [Deltaproteobacteria bacterium]|nr:pilus assembly protein PilP [Deltaproteobacteria bacterium]